MTETELKAFLAGILGQEAVIQLTSGYMSEGRYSWALPWLGLRVSESGHIDCSVKPMATKFAECCHQRCHEGKKVLWQRRKLRVKSVLTNPRHR
jgi:hypothetical protein